MVSGAQFDWDDDEDDVVWDETPGPVRTGEPVLTVEDAHVIYRVYEDRRTGLRTLMSRRFKRRRHRRIHAVRGISFAAYGGEIIGVIGHNGSGKSTLMQALAGLLPVNAGTIHARSQPALLGVNAALMRNLSGRRNIVLGCLALGMSNAEIEERMDEMIEFSGLEEFIDLPLKAYSAGMRARLHFTIATSISPDILLVDEAMSVGDAEFKQRGNERIRELRDRAGTIFIVSHSLKSIEKLCSRVLWIDHGELRMDGSPEEVLTEYRETAEHQARSNTRRRQRRQARAEEAREASGASVRHG